MGTGIGAAAAGAAGAAIGAVGGPVGMAIGAVVGAVAGGLAGKGIAESVNPSAEDEYWRANHATRPYYQKDYTYDTDYQPAYRHGWESHTRYSDKEFDDVEPHLAKEWNDAKGSSKLNWERAKAATRDAWDRVRHPGDATRRSQGASEGQRPVTSQIVRIILRPGGLCKKPGLRVYNGIRCRPLDLRLPSESSALSSC